MLQYMNVDVLKLSIPVKYTIKKPKSARHLLWMYFTWFLYSKTKKNILIILKFTKGYQHFVFILNVIKTRHTVLLQCILLKFHFQ